MVVLRLSLLFNIYSAVVTTNRSEHSLCQAATVQIWIQSGCLWNHIYWHIHELQKENPAQNYLLQLSFKMHVNVNGLPRTCAVIRYRRVAGVGSGQLCKGDKVLTP